MNWQMGALMSWFLGESTTTGAPIHQPPIVIGRYSFQIGQSEEPIR